MARKLLNNTGFGLVEGLVIVVLLAAVGGGTAYVYHRDHKTKAVATSSNATTSTTGAKGNKNQAVQPQRQYLDIKEWGVKLALSTPITDAYYVVSTSSRDANGQPNTLWLGLKSLDANGCSASNGNSGKSPIMAALVRVSPTDTDPVSGKSYKQLYPYGVTVGNYYYGYKAYAGLQNGSSCSSAANLASIDAAFKTAANNIVAG